MGTRWAGVLAPINAPTGDGRRMATGAFTHRPLPLPLRWQRAETDGHDDATVIGSIDTMRIDDEAGHVWGEGELFDDINPATSPQMAEDVATAKELLKKGVIGPSVDPGHASAVAVIAGTDEPMTDERLFEMMLAGATEAPATETLFTAYEIAGATLVPVPAFAECRPFELSEMDAPAALTASEVRTAGWADMPIAPRDTPWDRDEAVARIAADCGIDGDSPDWDCFAAAFLYRYTDRDPQTRGAYAFPIADHIDGQHQIVPNAVFAAANILSGGRGGTDIPAQKQAGMRRVLAGIYRRMAQQFDEPDMHAPWAGDMAAVLAAAAMQIDPALFEDPGLDTLTPITRRELGNGLVHVFGHIAEHLTCLVGRRDVCLTPPYSASEYSSFHRYHGTDDGSVQFPLPVGRLTAAFGALENTCRCCPGNDDHACANLTFGAAIAHHDRMQTLAYVRAGEDERNNAIWVSGIEAPGIDRRGRALLNRQKVSGDWREVRGDMELTEVLVLNRRNPGFPLPRAAASGGRQRSLTAAGVVVAPLERQVPTVGGDMLDRLDYDRLGAAVAGALMAAARPAAGADDEELAFNPNQRRGPDGKWIKMGGPGSAGGKRGRGLPGGRSSEGGGAGAGGERPENAQHRETVAELRDYTRKLREAGNEREAQQVDTEVDRFERALDEGDQRAIDNLAPVLAGTLWTARNRPPRRRGRRGAAPAAQRAERDRYNTAIRDLGMRVVSETVGDDEDDEEDFDDDTDLNVLDNMLSDLDDAISDGDTDLADRLADQIAEVLRDQWGERDRMPQRPAMTAAAQVHTGAMLALRMTEQDAARLAVTDGEPMEQLHLTLAYLGNADEIPPEVREKIEAEGRKLAASTQPITGDGFALNVFNPGTANDRDTALVLGVGGAELADIHRMVGEMNLGDWEMPQQHSPFVPHVTLQYTDDMDRVKAMTDRIGPVTFDRLRMAFGGDVIDVPLGGLPTVGQGYDLVNADMSLRVRAAVASLQAAHVQSKLS